MNTCIMLYFVSFCCVKYDLLHMTYYKLYMIYYIYIFDIKLNVKY